ncbi:hypothetical protein S7711_07860 [Stachybotrys chartarum IBT 7711]|uniref:Uncharacterized protein n=1 Tax=Stachybotrys chartarum (strain CBS 109288 / IBT 7711) TaxID=1280523 RepID=A0A084AXP6_STACB|nr:hypothetical protein S7711_07860 [Stachybotrys chartarum IBT 7711]
MYVEFRIASNPPLLPSGVAWVIDKVTEALRPKDILEILYEPEFYWFKCTTSTAIQGEVTQALEATLTTIMEEETSPMNSDPGYSRYPPDVTIIAEKPRVIPWMPLQHRSSMETYDNFRFPGIMRDARYKATWRELGNYPDLTITELLQGFHHRVHLPQNVHVPMDLPALASTLGCDIYDNTRQDCLYVATNTSSQELRIVLGKLDTMLRLYSDGTSAQPDATSFTALLEENLIELQTLDISSDIDEASECSEQCIEQLSAAQEEMVPVFEGDDLMWFGDEQPPSRMVLRAIAEEQEHLLDMEPMKLNGGNDRGHTSDGIKIPVTAAGNNGKTHGQSQQDVANTNTNTKQSTRAKRRNKRAKVTAAGDAPAPPVYEAKEMKKAPVEFW